MVKKIWDYIRNGISWGCTILVVNFVFNSLAGRTDHILFEDFPRTALGYILLGMGISFGMFVYSVDRLNIFQQSAIHAVIFYCSFLLLRIVSFGGIVTGTVTNFVVDSAVAFLVFAVVGYVTYQYHKLEVKEMNEALKRLEERNK